jgi:hypothetical protein
MATATLTQHSSDKAVYFGWYGDCENQCSALNLLTASFRPYLFKIHQIRTDGFNYKTFDGTLQPFPIFDRIHAFTTLDCGKAYMFILKEGTESFELPHFNVTTTTTADAGRIIPECLSC